MKDTDTPETDAALSIILGFVHEAHHPECVDACEKIQKVERELAEARAAMQWRPIETAPKDGTNIRIYDGSTSHEAWWEPNADFGRHKDNAPGWQVFSCEDAWYSFALTEDEVTHWMPLPPNPPQDDE